jgi:regulator of RNase E activity RraA
VIASAESDLSLRLKPAYSGAVYDVLRAMGYPNQVLPTTIRPLLPEVKLLGPAYTVCGHAKPNLDGHETLLQWTALLSKAPAGSVVVTQPNDSTMAHMGELSSETMLHRGVRGYITDGGCRDSAFIRKIGFPVFCRYFTPVDVVGRWVPEKFGEPVVIGEVTVHTGDYVFADYDGIVIIPRGIVPEVTAKIEQLLQTENLVRKAILNGVDPQEAYLQYGKF